MRNSVSILFFLFITSMNITGQNSVESLPVAGDLAIEVKNVSFIKNNEYYNPVVEGYTLIGYFLQPELIYSPSDRFSLGIGTHVLHYAGAPDFSTFKPVLSATYYFAGNSSFTIGSLNGSDKHEMADPHFNRERFYTTYSEEGLQLTFLTDHLFSDTWLSWENFIFKGDTTREIFSFGESFKYSSSLINEVFFFEIPLQLHFKHYGGQISNYPEPVETFLNLATGAAIKADIRAEKYGTAGIECLLFISKELSGHSTTGVSSGNAEWFRLNYSYKNLQLEVGYWTAHDFFAPDGNPIFGSVSDYDENVVIPDRKIITGGINLALRPESYLQLYIGAEAYWDINLNRIDSSVTLHLSFDKLFRITKIK
jgi:hypothetical protein